MNTDKITTYAGLVAAVAGSVLAYELTSPGSIPKPVLTICGVTCAVATVVKSFFTNKPSDPPPPSEVGKRVLEGRVSLLLVLLVPCLALGTGCALYGKRTVGETVSFTQSFVGIDVSQDPTSQVPHFRIGFGRNQGHIVPTSTNVLFSPSLDSSISLDSGTSRHAIAEDFRMGNATTNASPEVRATTNPNAPAARPR